VVLINEEAPAKGIELSIVTRGAVKPFVYPTPFVLHFSPMHLGWFQRDPDSYVRQMKGEDADLAAHCTVLLRRGIVLWGAPIADVFGEVPKPAYLDSILQDVAGAAEAILEDPLYITLNLCRVLAYAREGLVLSKQEGGQWGLSHLPEVHRPLAALALDCYASNTAMSVKENTARTFAEDLLEMIRQAVG
jgi:streptomycin 3"-adenylyltransferase